jgi:hypothetical protein
MEVMNILNDQLGNLLLAGWIFIIAGLLKKRYEVGDEE